MPLFFSKILISFSMLLLVSCAVLNPTFEPPVVSVSAFRVVPSTNLNPTFEIDLHIANPNNSALSLKGLSYSASIDGHKVLSGVSNNLPVIAAYGEGNVQLTAMGNLLGGISLMADWMNKPRDAVNYSLSLKLDVGTFLPPIYLEDEGKISFVTRF